ncbi:hypothetical protein ACLOJK_002617 [Asimina triloba]
MQGIPSSINPSHQIPLQPQQQQNPQIPNPQNSHLDPPAQDDFFDHMLSNLPSSWPDHKLFSLLNSSSKPRDLPDLDAPQAADSHHLHYPFDDSTLLASRLRQHQISGANSPKPNPMLLHQQHMLLPHAPMARSPSSVAADSGLIPLPLTLGSADRSQEEISAVNGFPGSLPRGCVQPANQQQQFHQTGSIPSPNFSAPSSGISQQVPTSAAAPKQRVRARRGQATDPHSIAERVSSASLHSYLRRPTVVWMIWRAPPFCITRPGIRFPGGLAGWTAAIARRAAAYGFARAPSE